MKCESLIKPPTSKVLKSGRVILAPGEEIGEHVTHRREELLIILRGTATAVKNGRKILLKQGETHYIKENVPHNVINESDEELEYVYVVSLFE